MDWYGPDDAWPRHGRDYFRAALRYARNARWWLGKFDDHSFGRAICDRDLAPGSRCEFLIFSSGSGSESAARELRDLVDRCPHKVPPGTQRTTAVEEADSLLDQAGILIEAAERCMNANNMQAAAEDLLELATAATETAQEALSGVEKDMNSALELEGQAHEERRAAAGLADAGGYSTEAPVEPEPLLGAADERVATAERRLGPASNTGRRRAQVRERAARTRARIQAMRGQLGI